MVGKTSLLLIVLLASTLCASTQASMPLYSANTTSSGRAKLYASITRSINNLSVPLTDTSEDKWMAAFYGMELISHTSPWEKSRLLYAFDSLNSRSEEFQRSFLELVYANYPHEFSKDVNRITRETSNEKIFAMAVEYLARDNSDSLNITRLVGLSKLRFPNSDHPIIRSLLFNLVSHSTTPTEVVQTVLNKNYLLGHTVLYSIQRKNRDFPGLVLIKDSLGHFVQDTTKSIFSVPQLARSLSNLPGYLTNGNTPQGLFRMHGFAVSHSTFIGPTPNIQLTMPVESPLTFFLQDPGITDSIWTEQWYSQLLPPAIRNYFPLYGSYFAGLAGRTEIISHGTTVDPQYYHAKTYFPFTPTEGCLCTKEFWSLVDGKRIDSDQEKLVSALRKAGGPEGYCMVIELDDQQKPVGIEELQRFLHQ